MSDAGSDRGGPRASLRLARLGLESFRNLEPGTFEPGAQFTVLSGANGQGKTSLLEAVYVACRGQSFRTSAMGEVMRHGESLARLRAVVEEEGIRREQNVALEPGKRRLEIDGKRPRSMADYALRTPVVVFHPGELVLTTGPASLRRQLLDRVAFFRSPSHVAELADYTKAQRARQRALEERGPLARDLEQWEELMVRHGLAIVHGRLLAETELTRETTAAFHEIAARDLCVGARYVASAPTEPDAYRAALAAQRVRDSHRGSSSIGPQRDEWELLLDAVPARQFASQGQHRALVLAIKSAEIEVVARARSAQPLVLLDDVSSELDRERTRALFTFLRRQKGQVLLTTTRPELVDLGTDSVDLRTDFELHAGRIRRFDQA